MRLSGSSSLLDLLHLVLKLREPVSSGLCSSGSGSLLAALLCRVRSRLKGLADHAVASFVALVAVALHALGLGGGLVVIALVAVALVVRLVRLVGEVLGVGSVLALLTLAVDSSLLLMRGQYFPSLGFLALLLLAESLLVGVEHQIVLVLDDFLGVV